jgi:leucyl-tRNA synthetase
MLAARRPGQDKHKFTSAEDDHLRAVVRQIGAADWTLVALQMSPFTPRQCRERWTNYLNPTLENSKWTPAEDEILETKYAQVGAKWRVIADIFPARSKNNVKYRWLRLQRNKHRVLEAQQAVEASEDANRVIAARDSIWSDITFETTPDSAAWDALFRDFPY